MNSEPMQHYCHDPKHERPCPLPCEACEQECDQKYWHLVTQETIHVLSLKETE